LAKLKQLTGAPALLHQADMPLYEHMDVQAQFLGVPAPEVTTIDRYLDDAATLEFGQGAAQISHTPGHTPGSVVLTLESRSRKRDRYGPVVLSGDTLFAGGIGRTDLWGGSFEDIMKSLRGMLLAFADDTVVIPGHGPQTTIGVERRTNPFLG
jgi:glyoxylase-like metal-dependent hydrolase (beta-lactamase superfamily II)